MMRSGRIGLAICMLVAGGCASRGNVELLESQLRQQEDQLHWMNTLLTESESDLTVARRELESLRVQMAKRGNVTLLPEQAKSLFQVTGVRVQKLFTGGLDRDGKPGDELLNVVIVPHDEQGETVKLPGELEIEAIDLTAPEASRKLGTWRFSSDEVARHWHSGLTSGFQFRLPWQFPPNSEDLVLNARYQTADGRKFGASAEIRVIPIPSSLANASAGPEARLTLPAAGTMKNLPPESEFFVEQASASEISLEPSATLSVSRRDEASEKPPLAHQTKSALPQANELFPIQDGDAVVSAADEAEFFPPTAATRSVTTADEAEFFPDQEINVPAPLAKAPSKPPDKATDTTDFALPQVQAKPAENPPQELVWKVMDESLSESVPAKPAAAIDGFRALKPVVTESETPADKGTESEERPMRYRRTNREFPSQALPRESRDQKP